MLEIGRAQPDRLVRGHRGRNDEIEDSLRLKASDAGKLFTDTLPVAAENLNTGADLAED
jgi:hypothetical protein